MADKACTPGYDHLQAPNVGAIVDDAQGIQTVRQNRRWPSVRHPWVPAYSVSSMSAKMRSCRWVATLHL